MASDWTDWADGSDLASMSRSTDPLSRAGYDPDDVRADPALRSAVMQQAASPYGLQSLLRATGPVTPAPQIDTSNAPARQPQVAPIPNAPVTPPRMTPASVPAASTSGVGSASTAPRTTATMPTATAPSSSSTSPGGSPQNSSDLDELGRQALEKGLALGNFAQSNAEALANADPDADPAVQALKAQEAKDATPTPYLGPDGKVLPSAEQYKPTGWQKFGRGLESAAIGLVTGGIPGAVVGGLHPEMIRGGTGYDAPNKAYQETEAERQQRLATDQSQLADAGARFKAMTDARKEANTAAGTAATAFGDVGRGVDAALPKPGEPRAVLGDNGKPTFATYQDGKWIDPAGKQIMNPQPVPAAEREAPQSVLINGKPGFALFDPQKGWLDPTPGPAFGQPLQGRVTPVPTRTEAGGAGVPTAPGNPTLTGDSYLATLPPGLRETVQAIGEYREPPPSPANRSKQAQELLSALNQAYPGYRADAWPTIVANRKAVTSGHVGDAINSFNTALNHLSRLEQNIPKENTGFALYNRAAAAMSPSGSQRSIDLGKWDTDANAVSNEVQKAYKGGTVNKEEYESMLGLLDRNAAPDKMRSNIEELRQLLNGKLQGFRDQYESGLPPGTVIPLTSLPGSAGGGSQQPGSPAAAAGTGDGSNWAAQFPKAN